MSEKHNFYGVGERVVDTLLLYALSDLARTADPRSTFSWNLGREIIFALSSSKPEIKDKMLDVLKSNARSISMAERLNFKLNVGKEWKVNSVACLYCTGNWKKVRAKKNEKREVEKTEDKKIEPACKMKGECGKINIPAYAVFSYSLHKLKSIDWPNAYSISKNKGKGYETLYIGLSPFWSKGVRQWDTEWKEHSSYVPSAIQVLLLYALSKYAIIIPGETLIELIFSPSLGTHSYRDANRIMNLVKRLITRFSISVKNIHIEELPISVVPLVMLSQMDLPSIIELSRRELELLFVAYDMDRGVPKNPRGYEERSLVDVANFYSRLGNSFWDFKRMIGDLVNQMWRIEFKTRILDILIDFSYAISGRNLWRLNDALFKVRVLADDLARTGTQIHLLQPCSAFNIQRAIEIRQNLNEFT
ncbi:MAG: hypothetical protein QXE05_05715 [Nitrososphaeria archaeon]